MFLGSFSKSPLFSTPPSFSVLRFYSLPLQRNPHYRCNIHGRVEKGVSGGVAGERDTRVRSEHEGRLKTSNNNEVFVEKQVNHSRIFVAYFVLTLLRSFLTLHKVHLNYGVQAV